MARNTQYDKAENVGLIYETGARHSRAFKANNSYLYAASGGIMQMPHAGTAALWFRPTNDWNDSGGHWYFDLRKSGESDTALVLTKWSNNKFYAGWIRSVGEPRPCWDADDQVKNGWNLLLVTWDDADGADGAAEAFLNNVSMATGTCPWSDTQSGTWNLRIGCWCINGDLNASADIADVTIWDVRLDATQRANLYSGTDSTVIGSPILHYPLTGLTTESASVGGPTLTPGSVNPPRLYENNSLVFADQASTPQWFMAESKASFFWSVNEVLYNGNGLFSDANDSVLLLVDGEYQYQSGGQSDPEPPAPTFIPAWAVNRNVMIQPGYIL
jgi:hypothetical protein